MTQCATKQALSRFPATMRMEARATDEQLFQTTSGEAKEEVVEATQEVVDDETAVPRTDDSSQHINHAPPSQEEQSEAITETSASDKDDKCSAPLQATDGAAVDETVAKAGDLNENDIVDVHIPIEQVSETVDTVENDVSKEVSEEVAKEQEEVIEKVPKVKEDENMEEEETESKPEEAEKEDEPEKIDSLNKMHGLEDVSEGRHTQPSSPGHASQRSEVAINQNGVESMETDEPKTPVTNGNHSTEEDDLPNPVKPMEKPPSPSPLETAEETPGKRRNSTELTTSSKKMRGNLEHQDFNMRNQILNSYMDGMDCTGIEGIKKHSEQLIAEIQKLGELAKVKEREWNQILHQRKLREELLLRLQRAKHIIMMQNNGLDTPDSRHKHNRSPPTSKPDNLRPSPKPTLNPAGTTADLDPKSAVPGRQGSLVDVQKLIADYRHTHPESVPRRGRRIRGGPQDGQRYDGVMTLSNMALGSGAQVRTAAQQGGINADVLNEFSALLGSMDNDRLRSASPASVKELLTQFSRMTASERQDLLNSVKAQPQAQPSYPEVTVHPVASTSTASTSSNSLLHGILTKARNEITITPVAQYEDHGKSSHPPDDEADDSVDRLVIDEGNSKHTEDEASEEVPQCQGCNENAAQFVCAGCGNQWYCSRPCQVSAWDEHSEVCSG